MTKEKAQNILRQFAEQFGTQQVPDNDTVIYQQSFPRELLPPLWIDWTYGEIAKIAENSKRD